jgi:hypothetical protein
VAQGRTIDAFPIREDSAMHAVLVSVEIHDAEAGRERLNNEVVPRASQAPGFVAGYWIQVAEGQGRSVIVMESEEAANAAAEMIRNQPAGGDVSLVDVKVGEVVANA